MFRRSAGYGSTMPPITSAGHDISSNKFPVRRLMAYAAYKNKDSRLAAGAWNDLWTRVEHEARGVFSLHDVMPPDVPEKLEEWTVSPLTMPLESRRNIYAGGYRKITLFMDFPGLCQDSLLPQPFLYGLMLLLIV